MTTPALRTEATPDELSAFLLAWPPGIGRLEDEEGADLFGLLMRRGEDVVWCNAGVFDAVADPMDLAERASRAVVGNLAEGTRSPMGAAAFVREAGDDYRVGVAVFAFSDDAVDQPGAGCGEEARALVDAVAQTVGVPISGIRPVPYDQIGTYRLQLMVTSAGLAYVSRTLPAEKDDMWHVLRNRTDIVHLPCVGFVDDAPPPEAAPPEAEA
jgi:hypothetical protein